MDAAVDADCHGAQLPLTQGENQQISGTKLAIRAAS
jgi:hypothetical protein